MSCPTRACNLSSFFFEMQSKLDGFDVCVVTKKMVSDARLSLLFYFLHTKQSKTSDEPYTHIKVLHLSLHVESTRPRDLHLLHPHLSTSDHLSPKQGERGAPFWHVRLLARESLKEPNVAEGYWWFVTCRFGRYW
ncbi:hypothetical protein NXS19_014053 [Fusarium pseudograminearum]|nr:hypothetical protein NXS19_014053 [Fusarium pseudograminearum]